jgi:hypothetical protein
MSQKPTESAASPISLDERRVGPNALDHIQEALRGLQFGEVTVTVQDGVAVQVERTERRRIHGSARKR